MVFANDGIERNTVGQSIVNVVIGDRSDYIGIVESYETDRREPHDPIDFGGHQLRRSRGGKCLSAPNLNKAIIAERSFFPASQALYDNTAERTFARSSNAIARLRNSGS